MAESADKRNEECYEYDHEESASDPGGSIPRAVGGNAGVGGAVELLADVVVSPAWVGVAGDWLGQADSDASVMVPDPRSSR